MTTGFSTTPSAGRPATGPPGGYPDRTCTSPQLGTLVHQLCTQHLLRDLDDAAEVYPDAIWPVQIAEALRALIHEANLAREQGLPTIGDDIRAAMITRFRHGVLVGLAQTGSHGTHPDERKARCLLEVPTRPRRRRAALHQRPRGAAHLQPGRT